MNLTIDREILIDSLNTISRGLPSKSPMPILMGIKLYATDKDLYLTSSNSDISVEVRINDESLVIEEYGQVVVPGRFFIDIIRKLNSKKVNLYLNEDNVLFIKVDRGEYRLRVMDPLDYPRIDFVSQENPFLIDSSVLKAIIRETIFATSQSEKKPLLTGVNFNLVDGKLTVTATDSFRLAQKVINIENYQNFNITVPAKSLDDLYKSIDNVDDELKIYISNNKMLVVFKNVCFQTRLLEGNFPDTSRLIPEYFPIIVKFNKDELQEVVERISLLSPRDKEKDKEITYSIIKFSLKKDRVIEISTTNASIGDGTEQVIPTDIEANGPITIGFSSRYLIEALRSFNSTEVSINILGDIRPFVLRGEGDANLTQLILPVRIDN